MDALQGPGQRAEGKDCNYYPVLKWLILHPPKSFCSHHSSCVIRLSLSCSMLRAFDFVEREVCRND